MKILIVTETLYEGGAELFLLRLAKALQENGQEVELLLLCPEKRNEQLVKQFSAIKISALSIPLRPLLEWVDSLFFKFRSDYSLLSVMIRKKIRKQFLRGTDIVHTHYLKTDWLVSRIKTSNPFHQVATVHGDYSAQYDHFKKKGRGLWNHMGNRLNEIKSRVNKWVLLSDEQALFFKTIMDIDEEKIARIYNGVEIPSTSPTESLTLSGGRFRFCMAGRGVKEKGWEKAIEAFCKMPDDCHFYLLGQSDYMKKLEEKHRENGRIHFLGFQPSPLAFFSQCDVLLMPSLFPFESLPNVIAESLSAGTPVIAVNTGEISKMIHTGEPGQMAGSLIDLQDGDIDEQLLYEQMKRLYDNPALLQQMRDNARKAALKFDMKKCVQEYIRLYRSLAG